MAVGVVRHWSYAGEWQHRMLAVTGNVIMFVTRWRLQVGRRQNAGQWYN